MPCLWLQHNNSQLFINVGIVGAVAASLAAGPLISANIQQPPQTFVALVDTGAQKTMISANVVNAVGLPPQGQIPIQGVGPNITYHNGYLFHVAFTIPLQMVAPSQMQVAVFIHPSVIYGAELPVPIGFDVLLGMDILSGGSLKIEGSGHFSYSF
jgi:hypothetical protein